MARRNWKRDEADHFLQDLANSLACNSDDEAISDDEDADPDKGEISFQESEDEGEALSVPAAAISSRFLFVSISKCHICLKK